MAMALLLFHPPATIQGGAINQTNHYNRTAGGVDADGLVRRIKQEQSEDIHQPLNMTKTDKF
ncbi:hypothetical protein [Citrobacter telavivensis]|uniref:hypothetical protein n=1 Tax=Citrobacter telavivensis TaxID=2653932 RepID=UPI00359D0A83